MKVGLSGLLALSLVASGLAAGCVGLGAECSIDQGSWSSAGGQQGVCNETNSFSYGFQGGGDASDTFTWENTEGQAEIVWGAQGSGSVTVTIHDADGEQVFQEAFSGQGQSGSAQSASGEPGDWTIEVDASGFGGQMGISVQAK